MSGKQRQSFDDRARQTRLLTSHLSIHLLDNHHQHEPSEQAQTQARLGHWNHFPRSSPRTRAGLLPPTSNLGLSASGLTPRMTWSRNLSSAHPTRFTSLLNIPTKTDLSIHPFLGIRQRGPNRSRNGFFVLPKFSIVANDPPLVNLLVLVQNDAWLSASA